MSNKPQERVKLRCCDSCAIFDICSSSVERCFNKSPDCEHCFECKSFKAKTPTPFVSTYDMAKARG